MTTPATQHIGLLRDVIEAQTIAALLGIAVADVSVEMRWHFATGDMEEGASEHWPRWPYDYRPAPRLQGDDNDT